MWRFAVCLRIVLQARQVYSCKPSRTPQGSPGISRALPGTWEPRRLFEPSRVPLATAQTQVWVSRLSLWQSEGTLASITTACGHCLRPWAGRLHKVRVMQQQKWKQASEAGLLAGGGRLKGHTGVDERGRVSTPTDECMHQSQPRTKRHCRSSSLPPRVSSLSLNPPLPLSTGVMAQIFHKRSRAHEPKNA